MTNPIRFTVDSSPDTLIERLQRAAAADYTYRFVTSGNSFAFEKVTQRWVMRGWRTDVVYRASGNLAVNATGSTDVDLEVTGDIGTLVLISIPPAIIILVFLVFILSSASDMARFNSQTPLIVGGVAILLLGSLVLLFVMRRADYQQNCNELREQVERILRR